MLEQIIELKLLFKSTAEAKIIYWAVKPDVMKHQRRSETRFRRSGHTLEIFIRAHDKNALRASFNAIMSHLSLAKKVTEIC
ncbi:MAG: KEOPS complex subunit Pcc1 [Candidatus Diapherotrites archaeon]|nr:KEOPS complex subunit Pcc1 [Candidatus Diapherotrites archaeon]